MKQFSNHFLLFVGFVIISGTVCAPSVPPYDAERGVGEYVSEATAVFDATTDFDEEAAAVPLGSIKLCDSKEDVANHAVSAATFLLMIDTSVVGNIAKRTDLLSQFYRAIDVFSDTEYKLFLIRNLRSQYKAPLFTTAVELRGPWNTHAHVTEVGDRMGGVIKTALDMINENSGVMFRINLQFFSTVESHGAPLATLGKAGDDWAQALKGVLGSCTQLIIGKGLPGCTARQEQNATGFSYKECDVQLAASFMQRSSWFGITSWESSVMPKLYQSMKQHKVDRALLGICSGGVSDWGVIYNVESSSVEYGKMRDGVVQEATLPRGDRATLHNGVRVA